jgi:hypothetical protein
MKHTPHGTLMKIWPDTDVQQMKQCVCVCVCTMSHVIVADVRSVKQAEFQKYALRSTNTT